MTDPRIQAARDAHASGGTVDEIAAVLDEDLDVVAEWLAAASKKTDVDPWRLVQSLVADAQEAMAAARLAGDSNAYKSLAATLGRLAPVLARLEETRREDGVRILPSEIDAADARVRALVDAALRLGA